MAHGAASHGRDTTETTVAQKSDGTKQTSGAAREPWLFNVTRDERDYGLTKEQCNIAFPELWEEIDRAVEVRKRHGVPQITEDIDLEGRGLGFMRVLIYDRQVSFCEYTH